ncbi:MAG: response regulator [Bacteroidota bacterium]|jgi:PAS domain S-box-containing protein
MENEDSVRKAIEQISSNLNHLSSQHEKSSWSIKGKNRLSEILRGDKKLENFADDFFEFTFSFLNCFSGNFYTVGSNNEMSLIHTYGSKHSPQKTLLTTDPFYHKIINSKKPCVLNSVKKDFFKIETSFGTHDIVSVIILPLFMNDSLIGLVELGKMKEVEYGEIDFLNEVSESVAIYLNSLLGKQKLENLIGDLDAKEQELQNQIKAINKTALVIEFDTNGNILNANDLFCQTFGFSKDEVIGKHHRIFLDDDFDYDLEFGSHWKTLNEGKTMTGEFERRDKNGKSIWLHASYNPVTDKTGKVYKTLKIGYDITEMKLQRHQLEVLTLKMNQQLEVLNKAAIVSETDADGNIIFVNDFFCQISEYSKEELIGKNHRILKSGKQPDGLFKGMWKAISKGLMWQGEILNKSKTGKFYWVETTILPFKDKNGVIEKYVAVRFDITKQKESEALQRQTELLMATQRDLETANTELEAQAQKLQASEEELRVQQEELMQSNKELEEKTKLLEEKNEAYNEKNNLLISASADLKKKAEQLELSSKYKSEFLANMSHELRTPLNSILLLSKLMGDNYEGNLNTDQIEYANVINKAGSSLLELINDILDLSKIESGKMDINPEVLSLEEFQKEIYDLFYPLSKDKSIDFKINTASDCPKSIFTDKLRIGQVIKNLLSNSFKFTPNGKVDLNVSMKDNLKSISFSVVDNGIGIAKEKQALIFEAFQQADGSTKRKYGGTGLGLSISREIAHLLGGEITLESEPGKGSDFTITIPVNYSADLTETNSSSDIKSKEDLKPNSITEFTEFKSFEIKDDKSNISPGEKVIMIVEDDVHFLNFLMNAAKENGYKVIGANNGRDGIEFAKKYSPTGIILDLNLPIKNGWEVMKELKANDQTKNIPVHIVSSQDLDAKSIKEIGAVDFSEKPLVQSDLKKLFQNLSEVSLKENGKVALFADRVEHKDAILSFLIEKNLQISAYSNDKESEFPEDFSIYDAIIIDVDNRKSKIANLLEKIKNKISIKNLPVIILSNTFLSSIETKRIFKFQNDFNIKIAKSYSGIIDEISIFLSFVSKDGNQAKMRPAIVPAKVLEGKKILVVDDDEENRFSIGKLMESQKVEVIYSVNGKEALDKFSRESDLSAILMDIMMPEMDGYEAMREIRKLTSGKRIPIIALTAKTQPDERENCLKNGASDYLPKPIDSDLLISLLRVWVNQADKNN